MSACPRDVRAGAMVPRHGRVMTLVAGAPGRGARRCSSPNMAMRAAKSVIRNDIIILLVKCRLLKLMIVVTRCMLVVVVGFTYKPLI